MANFEQEGRELDAIFSGLPLETKKELMTHQMNKRQLSAFRNLIWNIAVATQDLRTYTNLRCACKHFWRWLPPTVSDQVSQAILMPHVMRMERVISSKPKRDYIFQRVAIKDTTLFVMYVIDGSNRGLTDWYRVNRRTGHVKFRDHDRIIANVQWDDETLRKCFNPWGCPTEFPRRSGDPVYETLKDLNRPKKKKQKVKK